MRELHLGWALRTGKIEILRDGNQFSDVGTLVQDLARPSVHSPPQKRGLHTAGRTPEKLCRANCSSRRCLTHSTTGPVSCCLWTQHPL